MTINSILAALAMAQAAASSPPPPDPIVELQRNVVPIAETASGDYSGPGWERLINDGANSQFFMIGEQHGVADILAFARAAHRALAAQGYTHAAYEVGPWSMDFAEELIRSGEGNLAGFLSLPGNSLSIPFLFEREETALAEQIVRSSPDGIDALWGLDQEFVASGPVAARLLARWAKSPKERSAANTFAARSSANFQLVGSAHWSELAFLEPAFAANRRARTLVRDLKLSNEIYAPFTGRGGRSYDANLRRENYMKANFARRFAEAERRIGKAPKVFLKFGGNHAQKGFTGTDVPGLANFLSEWGVPRGFTLTNIMVECVGGLANNPIKGGALPCQPYFDPQSAIARLPKPGRLTLIDLRPMRSQLRRMKNLDQASRQLILSFDYYLAIRDVKPSTSIAAPPRQ